MPDDKPLTRIIPHEESIEVRTSRFFYFDDNPNRRSITGRMNRKKAEEAARPMPRLSATMAKIDLPPAVARAFVEDMKAYFAEPNEIKRDGIAVRQLRALREHQGPREKKLRLSDVKAMFQQMRDQA